MEQRRYRSRRPVRAELHPQAADGSVDIKKAVHINTQFEVSKQFWSYLTKKGTFGSCKSFISPVPHLSFVQGESGVSFLRSASTC